MGSERPTIEITTPGGFRVELKSYMTGREQSQIQDVFLKRMEIRSVQQTGANASAEVSGLQGSAATEAEGLTIKIMVVSLDGSAEDISNRVLDLPLADYNAIKEKIEEITETKKK